MRRAADASCLAAHFSFGVQQSFPIGIKRAQRADAQQSRGFVGVQFRGGVHFADGASTPCPVVQRTARTEDAFGLCLHFASICHRGFALEKLRLKPAATFHIPCVFEHTPRPFAMYRVIGMRCFTSSGMTVSVSSTFAAKRRVFLHIARGIMAVEVDEPQRWFGSLCDRSLSFWR